MERNDTVVQSPVNTSSQSTISLGVSLTGFKCYLENTSLTFSDGITLLRGPSGSGKTTILESIFFSLYDIRTGVYPRSVPDRQRSINVSTIINMRGEPLEISRSKPPSLFFVKFRETVYQGDEAVNIINHLLGDTQTFQSCCYMSQGGDNQFLYASEQDKLRILERVCFVSLDATAHPSYYINDLSQYISSMKKDLSHLEGVIKTQQWPFDSLCQKHGLVLPLSKPDDEELNRLIADQVKLKEQLSAMKKEVAKDEVRKRNVDKAYDIAIRNHSESKDKLHSMISIVMTDREDPTLPIDERVTIAIKYLKEIDELKAVSSNHDSLRATLDTIESMKTKLSTELEKIEKELESIDISQPPVKPKQLPPFVDEFQLFIATLEAQKVVVSKHKAEMRRYKDDVRRRSSVTQQIDELSSTVDPSVESMTSKEIEKEIASVEGQLDRSLECPTCHTSLIIKDKVVEPFDKEYLDKRLEILTASLPIVKSIESLRKSISTAAIDPPPTREPLEWEGKTIADESLDDVLTEVKSAKREARRARDRDEAQYKVEETAYYDKLAIYTKNRSRKDYLTATMSMNKTELVELSRSLEKVTAEFNKLTGVEDAAEKLKKYPPVKNPGAMIRDIESTHTYIASLWDTIIDMKKDKETMKDVEESLESIKQMTERLDNVTRSIDQMRIVKSVYDEWVSMEDNKAQAKAIETQLLDLEELRQHFIAAYYKTLSSVTVSASQLITYIASRLFEQPIDVKLNCFQESKSTHEVKPRISLVITLDGQIIESLNNLSGGEARRINIAFILAFNILSSSPFLLLDESLNYLNDSVVERTVETIRDVLFNEYKQNKPVIIISHMEGENLYDTVIDVESIGSAGR